MKVLIAVLYLSVYSSIGNFVMNEDYDTHKIMKDKTLDQCNKRLANIKFNEPISPWPYHVGEGVDRRYYNGIAIVNKAYCKEVVLK